MGGSSATFEPVDWLLVAGEEPLQAAATTPVVTMVSHSFHSVMSLSG
jgi:hypothetical protein